MTTTESTPTRITLRSRTGTPKGEALLVKVKDLGFQSTHNKDGRYRKLIGQDIDGVLYRTTSCGNWTEVFCEADIARVSVQLWGAA
tara:strand:- start:782 stop:1039 length:258 start_codon:yes stop_codon:yes gene_type:complete